MRFTSRYFQAMGHSCHSGIAWFKTQHRTSNQRANGKPMNVGCWMFSAGEEIGFGRAVSRILSAPCGGENHLSKRSIPETCFAFTKPGAGRSSVSYLILHPTGFSVPCCLRVTRCALAAPFHHHRRLAPEAVCFLWHCPSKGLEAFRPRVSAAISNLKFSTVTRRRALRSSDFPPPARAGSDSPPFQNLRQHTVRREKLKPPDRGNAARAPKLNQIAC